MLPNEVKDIVIEDKKYSSLLMVNHELKLKRFDKCKNIDLLR